MAGHAHFIGIAGIAMSAVALLLREAGWTVSGSDEGFYPPASEILPAAGIAIRTPHAEGNIPAETSLIVIGKHATLTEAGNPEVAEAFAWQRAGKVRVVGYPDVLAEVTKGRQNMVVCGSFGKSTTASLTAWLLTHAGLDIGYMLGARALNFASNSRLGTDTVFVMEGDEYPSSNTDSTAKFLHYAPQTVILTSAQHDHPNIFPTHADYLKPFEELIGRLGEGQLLVACADDDFVPALAAKAKCRVVTYGLAAGDYRAEEIVFGAVTRFKLTHKGTVLAELATTELGAHNVQNMVGAAAAVLENGLMTAAQLAPALLAFKGVKRRMERLTPADKMPMYEGFGSSADKAVSAIAAMRTHFAKNRLVVVFEPHTFGWRNPVNLPDYDTTFAGVDMLFVYPPHSSGNQLTQADILGRLAGAFKGEVVALGMDLQVNLVSITSQLRDGDVVLILTSGDLGGLIEALPKTV